MPELPEVETIRRQLQRLIVGRTISSIEVFNPGSFRADPNSLIGKSITGIGRKGKVLKIVTGLKQESPRRGEETPDKNLYIHLKMSGRLEFVDKTISNISKKARPFRKRPGLSEQNICGLLLSSLIVVVFYFMTSASLAGSAMTRRSCRRGQTPWTRS